MKIHLPNLKCCVLSFTSYHSGAERAKQIQANIEVKPRWLEIFSYFKNLLENEYVNTKNTRFYAKKLLISYKFLNDIVKQLTNKTAKTFIDDYVTIESKRYLASIHDDGSLHIFLEPSRAQKAIEAGWAVSHPFAVEGREGWEGFVMLYTPQTIEELNVIFQLIVDAVNYVTGQGIKATDLN